MTYSANLRAFLHMIRVGEGTADPDGYRRHFGGSLFYFYDDHPRKVITAGLGRKQYSSSAAGAYQFIETTWDECKAALNLPDFSPESQDKAAVFLIQRRKALEDVEAGRIEQAIRKCAKEWASLPGSPYGQPTRTMDQAIEAYKQAGGSLDEPAQVGHEPTHIPLDPINAPQGEPMDPLTFAAAALPAFLKAAPELTRIFGHSENAERNAKALEVVGQIAVEATGSPNVQDAAEQVSRSPEQARRFQEAVQDRWFELESAREKSVAAAREFNNAREQIKDVRTVLHTGLTFIELLSLVLVFVSVAGAVWALKWGGLDNQMKGAIVTLMLIAGYTGVREFWFGGSRLDEARKAEKE